MKLGQQLNLTEPTPHPGAGYNTFRLWFEAWMFAINPGFKIKEADPDAQNTLYALRWGTYGVAGLTLITIMNKMRK